MANDLSNCGFELLNDEKMGKLFDELKSSVQNQIVNKGFVNAGNVILKQMKDNYRANFKTGKLNLLQYFKCLPMKTKVGVRVGILPKAGSSNKSYLIGILEVGSYKMGDRFYETKKNHIKKFTGVLKRTDFLQKAIDQRKEEAKNMIHQSLIDSFNQTINKFENKK